MSKRHPAAWRPRDETYHPYIQAAKAQGYEIPALWTGVESYDRAIEIKRGIYNAAKHLKESVHVELLDADDGTITVKFVLHDKATARQYIKDSGRWVGK
jgi:hypothetical protein